MLRPSGRAAPALPVILIAPTVRDSINAIWVRNNRHWDELARVNALTQMLGTGPPTQREYMGCLIGHAVDDSVWVTALVPADHLRQLQFAVTGDCDHVSDLIGTWHTHPYRAALDGHALKEPVLSSGDLDTFRNGRDRLILAAWDVDSIDAAVRAIDGTVKHPVPVVWERPGSGSRVPGNDDKPGTGGRPGGRPLHVGVGGDALEHCVGECAVHC